MILALSLLQWPRHNALHCRPSYDPKTMFFYSKCRSKAPFFSIDFVSNQSWPKTTTYKPKFYSIKILDIILHSNFLRFLCSLHLNFQTNNEFQYMTLTDSPQHKDTHTQPPTQRTSGKQRINCISSILQKTKALHLHNTNMGVNTTTQKLVGCVQVCIACITKKAGICMISEFIFPPWLYRLHPCACLCLHTCA